MVVPVMRWVSCPPWPMRPLEGASELVGTGGFVIGCVPMLGAGIPGSREGLPAGVRDSAMRPVIGAAAVREPRTHTLEQL